MFFTKKVSFSSKNKAKKGENMKKALFVITLLFTLSCSSSIKADVYVLKDVLDQEYVQNIVAQTQAEDWCYIYQKVEPKEKNAYIVDFYVLSPSKDYTQWYCFKNGEEHSCELLFVKHL